MKAELLTPFRDYLQLRQHSRTPDWLWELLRVASVYSALILVAILFLWPETGLMILWRLVIPVLPLLFFTVPGLWRNACPLAAMNQLPRLSNLTRALTPPDWLKQYGYEIGMVSFIVLASSRKWLFNRNALASGLLLLGALVGALVGGLLFKGKSGWCSSVCPLYPVQRLYNQTPFRVVPNTYCRPCVGCTKNCYDFKPEIAYLADLNDPDPHYAGARKFFAAMMPGFVLAFFTLPDVPAIAPQVLYGQMLLFMLVSVALFTLMDTFLPVTSPKVTAVWGATAFSLFYWFALPGWLSTVAGLFGASLPEGLAWAGRAGILALSIMWVHRTCLKEALYTGQRGMPAAAPIKSANSPSATGLMRPGHVNVTFQPGQNVITAATGESLLDIAVNNNLPLSAGCRMGMCGADPVTIQAGMENLSPVAEDERATLNRLGLGPEARLACMCRVKGPITVSLGGTAAAGPEPVVEFQPNRAVKNVVIIGNGIAGVTAAETARRHHSDCAIHVIGREKHPLYNRMAINRLIYDRTAMSGLYLQSDAWYAERRITTWLNTLVTRVDGDGRQVVLATGDTISFDRLILACGSASFVPELPGFGLPGTFVLREADEAMEIRAYAQAYGCQRAIVAGGGLLGLEAAFALHQLGLKVTVLERGGWLLRRQLDPRSGQLLQRRLKQMGIRIRLHCEVTALAGNRRLLSARLKDGTSLPAEIFLMAAGIRPNIELANHLGLAVRRGILVDSQMQTSRPGVYAAGDVCEIDGQVPGLWSVALEQGRVAAVNAVGGQATYAPGVSATTLKITGVDVTSVGRVSAGPGEGELVLEENDGRRYRKLVMAGGRLVGAILLGDAQETATVSAAVKQRRDVTDLLPALLQGNWGGLATPETTALH